MRNLSIVMLLAVAEIGDVRAQEPVSYRPPARDFVVLVSGEHISYRPDGGCTSTAESRVSSPTVELAPVQCAASRMRTRNAVGAAIDAGALE